ncbi:uncharacterized protein LOC127854098 isoform X2 [Dreissena polymorpha]|uniref:uncharacterized protein LOC127854098 isoform X2 n=1 Tax=Dreissena polymorpha TaxID=45954 RepID=UPI0022640D1D|nr:uncharacterized protein LOC127854098 isoform X2 [Dreissena polymorpha]
MHPCVRFVRTGQRILKHRCVRQVKQPNRNMGAVADEAFVRGQVPKHPKWWWHFSACITGGLVLWCGLMSYRHTYHVINTDPNPVNKQVSIVCMFTGPQSCQ